MRSLGRTARWISITTVLIVIITSGAVGAGQSSDDFVVYEDWTTADHIRSDRWSQAGDVSQDTRAELQGDHVVLRHRRQAAAATDVGIVLTNNRLLLTHPETVDHLAAEFTVRHLALQACPANPMPASVRAAAIDFSKFSDLDPSIPRVPGSLVGDYFARVQAVRSADSTDPEGILTVLGIIVRCNNPSCSDATTIQLTPLGQVTVGQKFEVRLIWDPVVGEFRAGLDRGADVSLPFPASLNVREPNVRFGGARVFHRLPNCTAASGGPIEMDVETRVGTVKTNASAVIP